MPETMLWMILPLVLGRSLPCEHSLQDSGACHCRQQMPVNYHCKARALHSSTVCWKTDQPQQSHVSCLAVSFQNMSAWPPSRVSRLGATRADLLIWKKPATFCKYCYEALPQMKLKVGQTKTMLTDTHADGSCTPSSVPSYSVRKYKTSM